MSHMPYVSHIMAHKKLHPLPENRASEWEGIWMAER